MTTRSPEIDLATIDRGSVTAPAGFGKTQVIADTIAHHREHRFLVLTHTNAGVRALHDRIAKVGAHRSSHIDTISGLALRLARAFPTAVGWSEEAGIDHAAVKSAAQIIVRRPTVRRALLHGYDQIIVDEYQDCSMIQHQIVSHLADYIPTVVLGDPLQAIFDFDGEDPLISWSEVLEAFPHAGTLSTPHRWTDTNPTLGHWLKSIREPLTHGHPVPLPTSGIRVFRMQRSIHEGGLNGGLPKLGSNAVLIPDSKELHEIPMIAKKLAYSASVHESAEQPDLLAFVHKISDSAPAVVLLDAIHFTTKTTTNINAQSPVKTLIKNLKGHNKPGVTKNEINALAHRFIDTRAAHDLAAFISKVISGNNCQTYRPGLLYGLLAALRSVDGGPLTELPDATRTTIDARRRMAPPPTNRTNIGSTLRMKGLEYDSITIYDPNRVPTAQHLYVALSRARWQITLAVPPATKLNNWFSNESRN